MSGLSNLFKARNAPRVVVRPVAAGEISVALSLLLGQGGQLADGGHVADFEEIASRRGIDLTALQLALIDDRLAAAALPVPSPGRTVLLLLSPAGKSTLAADLVARCAAAAVGGLPKADRPLVQILLDPAETGAAAALEKAGFAPLATLIYLNRRIVKSRMPAPPADVSFVHYTPATHDRFARAIQASYDDSLDCPPMRGLRHIDDIIAGHRATGDFDPNHWYCFTETDAPDSPELGVLLLAPVTAQPMTELVYLGVSPAARGRGLGDTMLRLALHTAAARGDELLTLAVDSGNAPALRLYHRHGLAEIARRVAMFKPPPTA